MRTSYISNDVKARRQQQAAEAGQLSDLLEDEIKAIEVTTMNEHVYSCNNIGCSTSLMSLTWCAWNPQDGFAAAEQPPQHATKPGMQAVEVLPGESLSVGSCCLASNRQCCIALMSMHSDTILCARSAP